MREPLWWLHDRERFARENPRRRWTCSIHDEVVSPPLRQPPHCPLCSRLMQAPG